MASGETPSSFFKESLSLLDEQEREYQSTTSRGLLNDHILSLKIGLPFLENFFYVSTNKYLKTRIQCVVCDVREELRSLSNTPKEGSLSQFFVTAYSNMWEKVKNVIIDPTTGENDLIFSELSRWQLKMGHDFLVESLRDLSSVYLDRIAPVMKEIEGIKEKLILLVALVTYIKGNQSFFTKEDKKLMTPLLDVINKASCLLYTCLVEKMDEDMAIAMKYKLSDLLEKIKVDEFYILVLRLPTDFRPEELEPEFFLLDNLIRLLDYNTYLNIHGAKLNEKLKKLRFLIENLPQEERLETFNYLIKSIEAIAFKAIPILRSCYDQNMKEDKVAEVNAALSEIHYQIEDIQAEVKEIKLYSYPKTDVLGFLDLFLGHLQELHNCRLQLDKIFKNHIDALHVDFDFLRCFIGMFKENLNEREDVKDLWVRICHLAYRTEHVVDYFLVKNAFDDRINLSLYTIRGQIELIKSDVISFNEEKKYQTQSQSLANTSSLVRSQPTSIATDEFVGFKNEVEKIMEYLVGGEKQLDVISIVGIPGLGKSTIAKKVYKDPLTVNYFDVRAWCPVSRVYRKEELFLTILGHLIEINSEVKRLNEVDLALKLHQSLKGQRYLIVLDDVWDIKVWNEFTSYFPNDQSHSRILITTRLIKVASQIKVGVKDGKVHALREFNNSESWELFQKKLLQKESFSQKFLGVGQQIAKRCNGLPLSIVVMAGLLPKVEKTITKWNQIAESLSSMISSDTESQSTSILETSYNHLPDHLKSCFLYLGTLAEDGEISVRRLKWLWFAEGFVKNTYTNSLDDAMEESLMDLISRSLVIATQERSLDGVKACRVHNLLRNLCLEKAREENFLQVIRADSKSKFLRVNDQRRLSIYSKSYHLGKAKPFGCSVRTLLHTSTTAHNDELDISFISQNFKLLRVLELSSMVIPESFCSIELLIHLRYLAIKASRFGANVTSISSSIANLWNLQIFIFQANRSYSDTNVVGVPDSIWDMVNLRHVHIKYGASFNVRPERLVSSSLPENLESLSTPRLSYGEDTQNLLSRLRTLRKLGCVFLEYWDDSNNCCRFPVLEFLDQLVSLKVCFESSFNEHRTYGFNFPSNLQKLALTGWLPPWNDISKIGKALPNLKVLKLAGHKYGLGTGSQWSVNKGDFPKLKCLKLSNTGSFKEWNASRDSFPSLEQLVLENCENLERIPSDFRGISTLRIVTIKRCRPSVHDSAKTIRKDQHNRK